MATEAPHVEPRELNRSDVNAAVRYVAAHVKAPAVGPMLVAAKCADPSPTAGKRTRLRNALSATQERDGHSGGIVRLIEAVAGIQAAEERHDEAIRVAYSSSGATLTRAKVRTQGGHSLNVGVTRAPDDLAVSVIIAPGVVDLPLVLDQAQARELIEALELARREVDDRLAERWPRGRTS